MANYSQKSSARLALAHPDLVILFNEVIKDFDNVIAYSYRTPAEQFELFKKGRSLVDGIWVVTDKSQVVTYKDGFNKLSMHNYSPSRAVDAMPYPVNWKDTARMYYFAGYVMGVASRLKRENRMAHSIRWGGDWDGDTEVGDETFLDLVHFEIII